MDGGWKYYDFDANWPEVYRLWQSEEVQDALEPNMQSWCETELNNRMSWNRGDSLWDTVGRTITTRESWTERVSTSGSTIS